MFIPSVQDAGASTASAAFSSAASPTPRPPVPREQLRHMLFGSPAAVKSGISHLHKLGYADPNDWSRLLSTGRANEVMAILTKRVEA